MDITNKCILICGATGGIGQRLCKRLLSYDNSIIALGRSKEKLLKLTKDLDNSPKVHPLIWDCNRPENLENITNGIKEKGLIPDKLVYLAGMIALKPFTECTCGEWQTHFNVNFFAAAHLIKNVLPFMIEKRSGKIVLMSSIASIQNPPFLSMYNCTKGALNNLVMSLANELALYNIQINSVCPHMVRTNFSDNILHDGARYSGVSKEEFELEILSSIRSGSPIKVDDVCNVVELLLSDDISAISGECIKLAG